MTDEFLEGQRQYIREKEADDLRRTAFQDRCALEIALLSQELAPNFPKDFYDFKVMPESIKIDSAYLRPNFDKELNLTGWSVRVDDERFMPFLSGLIEMCTRDVLLHNLGKYHAATLEEKKQNAASQLQYEHKRREEDRSRMAKARKDEFWDNVAAFAGGFWFYWVPILVFVVYAVIYSL